LFTSIGVGAVNIAPHNAHSASVNQSIISPSSKIHTVLSNCEPQGQTWVGMPL